MTRLLLKAINGPGLLLIAVISVALQSTLFQTDTLRLFQPDLILFIVIWCALKRDILEGGVIVLILSNLGELHSTSPQGVPMVAYTSVYLLIRLFDRLLVVSSILPLTLGAFLFIKLEQGIILKLMDAGDSIWRHILWFAIPGCLIQGTLSRGAYRFLTWYDRITLKDPLALQALDSGFQLDDEGL